MTQEEAKYILEHTVLSWSVSGSDAREAIQMAIKELKRKRGEWIKNEDRCGWHCSCCKVDNYYAYCWNSESGRNEFQDNFCPNCGSDMRGEANDK